jgi:hypothetical protein
LSILSKQGPTHENLDFSEFFLHSVSTERQVMLEGLFGTRGSSVGLPLQKIDINAYSRKRNLKSRGETDGRANVPAASSSDQSAAEREIILDLDAERGRLTADAAAHFRAQNDALATLETAMDIAAIRKDTDEVVSTLRKVDIEWKGEILRMYRTAQDARVEYDEFRQRHRLSRPARQPKSPGLALSWLALSITLESILNGTFFAEGSASGLIGGIGVALAVSVINVALLGAVLGFFPARWAHHRNGLIKLLAILMLAAGIAAMVLVNGFVAHFRDAYERLGDEVILSNVFSHLISNPFDLMRLQSWLLFFLGLGFAFFGFAKGYELDDPYPGYGAVDRRRAFAETVYAENRQIRIEDTTHTRDRAIVSLSSAIERLRGASAQRDQILASRSQIVSDISNHEAHLEQATNALLGIYRDANRRSRTEPPPQHFSHPFKFGGSLLDRLEIRTLLTTRLANHNADQLLSELDRLRDYVLTSYHSIIDNAPAEV